MKVLIVEDTDTITSLIQIYLMGWKLEFEVARNGKDALERARKSPPALVLSDVQMPEMDGFALCAAIRADKNLHKVPFVLLTSLKDEESRSRGRMVGATAFLSKPVSVEALRSTVGDLLNLPKTR